MHIGFDAKRFFHNVTGLGNYSRSTILGLAKCFPEHRYFLYAARVSGKDCTTAAKQGFAVQKASPAGNAFPALWRSFALPSAARRDRLDIFHGLSHELPFTSFPATTRTVVSVHDLLFLTHPHRYPRVDRTLYALKYRASCRRADLVVAISEHTAEEVRKYFGIPTGRIRVAYQSCDPAFAVRVDEARLQQLRRTYGLSGEYILFVGSLIPRKGVDTLLRALAALPSSIRPELAVVGAGPQEKDLRRHADALGLAAEAHFLGRVPPADLPGLYQMAHVFAYPSEAEGFGIPILEALYSRVPVVTSTGSCFREAGGDAALYAPPGDVPALTQALERVVTDEPLRRDMVEKGAAHAGNFHIEKTSARLMDIYKELHG